MEAERDICAKGSKPQLVKNEHEKWRKLKPFLSRQADPSPEAREAGGEYK